MREYPGFNRMRNAALFRQADIAVEANKGIWQKKQFDRMQGKLFSDA